MLENFDLQNFSIKHEGLLREHIIDNTVKLYSRQKMCKEIKNMLMDITIYNPITLAYSTIFSNVTIPSSVLMTFKPLLYHYMRYLYSTNSYYRQTEYSILIKKLIAFKDQNPLFITNFKVIVPIHKLNYKNVIIPQRNSNTRFNHLVASFIFTSEN
jgi:hypothetical protein